MTTADSTTVSAARLDKVLGSVKRSHQLAGCRTCGIMSMLRPAEESKRTA